MTPSQWRAEPPDDRALMMALEMFEGVREAYRSDWKDKRRDKKSGAKNEFEEMKRRKGL